MKIRPLLYSSASKLIVLCLTFSSCKKFIEVPIPVNQQATVTVFSDEATATSAVNGLYSSMMIQNFGILNSGITLYPALSADELINTNPNATISSFTENTLNSENTIIEFDLWKRSFNYIYQTNAILKGLSNSNSLSMAVKNQLMGEAKFVRALCYFYLINIFGDVPYIVTTDYQENSVAARVPKATIYNSIQTELQEASNLLGNDYPSTGKVRPNKWAAISLLARVYLYRENWAAAEQTASLVINSGIYSLSGLNNVFVANSTEVIWQLMPVLTFLNTADGLTFIPFSATVRPAYGLTAQLMNSFETGDQRLSSWTKSNIVSGVVYYYPFKYKVRSGSAVTEYNTLFRLPELYLIRAEARTMQNKIAEAKTDLNVIRTRAGLSNSSAGSQVSMVTAIEHERQIEFFAECGHRWFDLKRTGRADAVLGSIKTSWQATDALYPIPLTDIQTNPSLTQNPGY
ncbi:MAG: RagB/SusD family nutrient uptake outer membrane protein [Chitinophagaceae bacterium]|nr:MAG: RagB/SusD family nutrient uptake outer membrane protein [Chitinophagaceae bacterium]